MIPVLVCACTSIHHPFSTPVTKKDIFDHIGKKKHVILHFYAPDCQHCQKIEPIWNEVSRMYSPVDDIEFAVIDCDRWRSTCVALDGASTPTIKYYTPGSKDGQIIGSGHSIIDFVKTIRQLSGLLPYTKPKSLLYTKYETIEQMIDENPVLVVVDDPKKMHYNQTEIRQCEQISNIEIRAIAPTDSAAKTVCKNGVPCITLVKKNELIPYEDEIKEENIKKFLRDNEPSEL